MSGNVSNQTTQNQWDNLSNGPQTQGSVQTPHVPGSIYFESTLEVVNGQEVVTHKPYGRGVQSPTLEVPKQNLPPNVEHFSFQSLQENLLDNQSKFLDSLNGQPLITVTDPKTKAEDDALMRGSAYDDDFETSLSKLADSQNLTPKQVNQLRLMHYAPAGTTLPTDASLKALLKQVETQANELFQATFGPGASLPKPSSSYFSNILNGAFVVALRKKIDQLAPPLTAEQRKYIDAYLTNPEDPGIPKDVRDTFKKFLAPTIKGARDSVITEFNLDPTWQPTVKTIAPPNGVQSKLLQDAQNGIDNAKDMLNHMKDMVDHMPPGPDKVSAQNFILHVSSQLNKLQEAIYASQIAQSKADQKLTNLKMEQQLADIAQQNDAAQQEQNKTGKMSWMPPGLQKFMEYLGDAIMVAVAVAVCATNPVLGVALTVLALIMISSPQWVQNQFQNLTNVLCKACNNDQVGHILAFVIKLVIAGAVAYFCPTIGFSLLISSGCLPDLFLGLKFSKEDADKYALYVTIAITVITVLISIRSAVKTGGSAAVNAAKQGVQVAKEAAKETEVAAAAAEAEAAAAQEAAEESKNLATTARTAATTSGGAAETVAAAEQAEAAAAEATAVAKRLEATSKNLEKLADAAKAALKSAKARLAGALEAETTIGKLKIVINKILGALNLPNIKNLPKTFIYLAKALEITSQALAVAQGGIDAANNSIMSDITEIKHHSEARSEEIKAIIAALQQDVDNLLAALGNNTSFLTSIAHSEENLFKNASQVTTGIWSASRG